MALKTNEYDVVVVGGGPAGIGAATAAARNGVRTIVIEQNAFLGGNLTMDLAFLTFHDHRGVQILNGIPQEVVDRLKPFNGTLGHVSTPGAFVRTYTNVDPEVVKYVAQEMILEAGGTILLHTFVTNALVEGNRVTGVVVEGKGGAEIVRAKVVVDCSGDADVATLAGAPFQKGREKDGSMQATTMMFRLGHVDTEQMPEHFNQRDLAFANKFGSDKSTFLMAQADISKWSDQWEKEGMYHNPNRAVAMSSLRDGELKLNTTRITGIDATDKWDLTRAEIEGRRQVMAVWAFLKKHVPGFERSALMSTGPHIGVRETRRIKGEYTLTADDVLTGREFPDNIGRCAYCVDIHQPDGRGSTLRYIKAGRSYGIPYRILLPQGVEQLLVAGRCVSATHEAAASVRVMGAAMAMGQAAGTAAALSIKLGVTPRSIDTAVLRGVLRQQGAVLEESDSPGSIDLSADLNVPRDIEV